MRSRRRAALRLPPSRLLGRKYARECVRECVPCLFGIRTFEHTFRQDPVTSEQQGISATETESGYWLCLCVPGTYGNYSPANAARLFPRLFHRHETDPCPALRQDKRGRRGTQRERERERRRNPFSRVHKARTICQNSSIPSKDLTCAVFRN